MSPSAIIFDCDGVLVDSETIYCELELAHLGAIGLHYDKDAYQARFAGLPPEGFAANVAQDYARLGKGDVPPDFHDNLRSACAARFETELVQVAGATDFVAGLRLPIAVASSTRLERLHWKLKRTGLHESFDPHIYSGEQVEQGKPEPDLFLFAARQLDVPVDECLVIEDSENGVRAGVAAGMTVIGFCGGGHATNGMEGRLLRAGASVVCCDFADLRAYLSDR